MKSNNYKKFYEINKNVWRLKDGEIIIEEYRNLKLAKSEKKRLEKIYLKELVLKRIT